MAKQFSPITIARPDLTPDPNRRAGLVAQSEQNLNPNLRLDAQFQLLGDKYEALFDDAVRTGRDPTGIQREYDRAKAGLVEARSRYNRDVQEQQQKIEQVDQLERSGAFSPEQATEVRNRITLGSEAEAMMYPPEGSKTGMSINVEKGYYEAFTGKEVKKELTTDPPGWGRGERKYIDPQKMMGLYFRRRAVANFRPNDPKLFGFNNAFAKAMSQNEDTKKVLADLLETEPKMQAAFAHNTQLNEAFLSKFKVKGMSPLAKHFNRVRSGAGGWAPSQGYAAQQPAAQQLDDNTAMQILQEAGGDKELARQIARSRGLKF